LFPALRERAGNKGAQFSGGEQQMLAIARALASDPKVLLLDEPSQGLAPLVVRELARVIRLLRSDGVAILLIEQNVKLAEEVADEINVMVKGRIVYAAAPTQYRCEEDTIRRRFLTVLIPSAWIGDGYSAERQLQRASLLTSRMHSHLITIDFGDGGNRRASVTYSGPAIVWAVDRVCFAS
jgi:ABC-type multidrug transport system ATPase subunit